MSSAHKNIFLIGPRACGKSTLAPLLAARLGLDYADTDTLVTAHVGMSIAAFVQNHGWEAFRDQEQEVLRSVQPGVVATGGGIVLRPENCVLMRQSGIVFYLCAAEELLLQRLVADSDPEKRPSLKNIPLKEEIAQICAEREHLYRHAAHYTINANLPPAALCEEAYLLVLFTQYDI